MSCPGWDSNARHSAITYMCFCCSTVHVFRDIDLSILQCAILYTTVVVYTRFVFEDQQCRLFYYNSHSDFAPLGYASLIMHIIGS